MTQFCAILLLLSASVNIQARDYMSSDDKYHIESYTRDLIKDITRKVHQTDGLFEMYGDHFLFEIGFVLGQIREKHKLQMEYYRQFSNKFRSKLDIVPYEYLDGIRPIHYFIGFEHIHRLELEIDNLVESLIRIPPHVLDSYKPNSGEQMDLNANMTANMRTTTSNTKKSGGGRYLRAGYSGATSTTEATRMRAQGRAPGISYKKLRKQEADFKKGNRASYLLRHGKRNSSAIYETNPY